MNWPRANPPAAVDGIVPHNPYLCFLAKEKAFTAPVRPYIFFPIFGVGVGLTKNSVYLYLPKQKASCGPACAFFPLLVWLCLDKRRISLSRSRLGARSSLGSALPPAGSGTAALRRH